MLRLLVRAENLLAFWCHAAFWRVTRGTFIDRPADFNIALDGLHRMNAHWALTFARLGTVNLPAGKIREMGAYLDAWSYLNLLAKTRQSLSSRTIVMAEGDGPAPSAGKYIRVSFDYYGGSAGEEGLHYPYVVHPWLYAFGRHRRLSAYRKKSRRIRLFFSGASNVKYGPALPFPIISRHAIVEYLVDTFRSDAYIVTEKSELPGLDRTDRPIVVVLFKGEVNSMATHHLLTRDRYLTLLASSHFALCPPGAFIPHSHNLIEAMAVGTIPVTNYWEYCRPRLIDGKTCVAFSDSEELNASVKRVLAASDGEMAAMHSEVANCYDDFLSPEGFSQKLAKLLSGPGPEYKLVVNGEWITSKLWEKNASAGSPGAIS